MDFDIATAAIGIGLLLICLTPILWLHWSSLKGDKKLKELFAQLAQKEMLQLTMVETWATRYSIGFDQNSGKLLYSRWLNGNLESININLATMKNCLVSKEMDGNTVDKVYLQIQFKDEPQQKLEFYNSDYSPSLSEEYLIAQKWQQALMSNK